MIGRLRGEILHKQPPWLLLDVNGVGYELEAPMSTFYDLPAVGEQVILVTHLAVREDAHTLYWLLRETDRALFRDLLKVTGVGARMALAILSGMDARRFAAEGSPADCVLAGIFDVMTEGKPDLVLSGVNRGNNAGENIMYSGTVGAAMEAALQGVRSIALSQFFGPLNSTLEDPFDAAARPVAA